jgi:hypothetical protein
VRTEADALGHTLVYGPGNDPRPAVWLQWKELIVDPSVQRGRQPGHKLLRYGTQLDYNLTEALTVAPVFAPSPGGGEELAGYRVDEGQHRTILGQSQDPDGYQLCKITYPESREDAVRTGAAISHGRTGFGALDDWHALVRQGNPNVLAATQVLSSMGYLVTVSRGARSIAAAGSLLRIAGIRNRSEIPVETTKSPDEAAADLADVLTAVEGIADEDDEGPRRYRANMLNVVYEVIDQNRYVIDIERLRAALSTRTAAGWLALNIPALDGRANVRAHITAAYNKHLTRDSNNRIS